MIFPSKCVGTHSFTLFAFVFFRYSGFTGLFAVRQGETAFVYVNSCPHLGAPLNWREDDFLSADGSVVICATHGATFAPATGLCLSGPCRGAALERVPVRLEEGVIFVPDDAGL